MGYRLDCLVLSAETRPVVSYIRNLQLSSTVQVGSVGPDLVVVHPNYSDGEDSEAVDDLISMAESLSTKFGKVILIHYDDRRGIKTATVYDAGDEIKTFSEEDERYVSLGNGGVPLLDYPTIAAAELDPEKDYEPVVRAIDLGLRQLDASVVWETIFDFVLQNDEHKQSV